MALVPARLKHNYQTMYTKYFEMGLAGPNRTKVKRLFEIGLGCNMDYGPGKSAQLWRKFFPSATIWFAESDTACLAKHQETLSKLNVSIVSGDQANATTLAQWIKETGGNFDVIIDDGGHQNRQIFNSFVVLFKKALKPGGLYVIEDLQCSRVKNGDCRVGGKSKSHSILDVLKDWIEQLATHTTQHHKQAHAVAYTPKYHLMPGIKSIECFSESCAIVKCYVEDPACSYGNYARQHFDLW